MQNPKQLEDRKAANDAVLRDLKRTKAQASKPVPKPYRKLRIVPND